MDSKALTKIQSVTLIAIIVVAAVAGSLAYVFLVTPGQSVETIKIGICADLDNADGKRVWHAAVLAAEQVNAEGGVLGRNFTIVAEDDDDMTLPADIAVASNALTRLITVDKADYVMTDALSSGIAYAHQDIAAEQKKIIFGVSAPLDNLTQRVLDNYDRYKYYFRPYPTNITTVSAGMFGDIMAVGNYTGFTKVALLFQDSASTKQLLVSLNNSLPKFGFEIVYSNLVTATTTDFTSYFAAIEAAGAQILVPAIATDAAVSFVKEWHERQSPFVIWGIVTPAGKSNFWELTEGKCDTISFAGDATVSGYPLTNKTLLTREAYIQRWGEVPTGSTVGAYDTLRFILPDAIKRAGTTETEAVIKALETTNVETSMARHFVFTSSHDVMVGSGAPNNPAEDYMVKLIFQWQNGTQVPVRPVEIMKEAGATYKYPPWSGPWGNRTEAP